MVNLSLYEKLASDASYHKVFQSNDGALFQHQDAINDDLTENLEVGIILAISGRIVELPARNKSGKNPDFLIDGVATEMYTPQSPKNGKKAFTHAIEKGIYQAILRWDTEFSINQLIGAIRFGFKHNNVISLCLILANHIVIEILRQEFTDNTFVNKIKKALQ